MASIVTDVLNVAGVLVKEDMPSKVNSFKRKIEGLKLTVQEILKYSYIDFIPRYMKLDQLAESLDDVKKEYEVLRNNIEKEMKPQMNASVTEYNESLKELQKIAVLKQAISDLISLHKHFEGIKLCHTQKLYQQAVDHVFQFEEKYATTSSESTKDLDILVALRTEQIVAKNQLVHYLQEYFRQRVSVTKTDVNKKYLSQTELTIQTDPKREFSEVVCCLMRFNELHSTLRSFAKTFLDSVCRPITCYHTQIEQKVLPNKTTLLVSVLRKGKPDPSVVLNDLLNLFNNLHSILCSWLEEDNENVNVVVIAFGNLIQKDFCQHLVQECLQPSIPSQSTEFENFQVLVNNAVKFHDTMLNLGFFSAESNKLKEFIDTVNELPSKKMALEYLGRARSLMKKELYQTVVVGVEESPVVDIASPDETGKLTNMPHTKSGLCKNMFDFPSCHISVFAEDLVKLLHQITKEAKDIEKQSPLHSLKLFATARDICELYCSIVPTYHKEQISEIPQQTAIHHNNCMYIAHCLLTLGLAKHTLQALLPVTFVDLVPEIRRLGTEAFLSQMRTQRQHLLQLLKDPEAFQSIAQDNNLTNKAEKTIHQCLQQLEFLKRVWSDILPVNVYYKAIGTLLNTFLEEVISQVLSMEDITATSAALLDSVFAIVLKQSPELFKVERGDKRDMVHVYVRRWFKFQELQLVLGAALREIVDRWSGGKGPLATHFTADEVKHLIRALFQNTERRAAALGKIR